MRKGAGGGRLKGRGKFMKQLIIILILLRCLESYGQKDSLAIIDEKIRLIDSDSTLQLKVFDAPTIYDRAFDNGGEIKIYFHKNALKKIIHAIGVSFGRVTTIIYLDQDHPIKIIDREENFGILDDQTGWDYSKLKQVFQADIYIFDWELDKNKIIKTGKRNLSEGTCGIFEYEPIVSLCEELLKRK